MFRRLALLVAISACGKKDDAVTKSDNGEVTTTKVRDKQGHELDMQVDHSECATKDACLKKALEIDVKDKRHAETMKRACDLGESTACYLLGDQYYGGEGVAKDFAAARTFAQRACDKNDAGGCALLSLIYLNGDGIEVDNARALELGMRACDAAAAAEDDSLVATACGNAGVLLAAAKPVDAAKVGHYFERACAIHVDQCTNLGVAIQNGMIGPKDPAKARPIFQKACDANVADACSALGRQLVDGVGGPKDVALAKTLFDKACKGGSKPGCINQKKYP